VSELPGGQSKTQPLWLTVGDRGHSTSEPIGDSTSKA